jgi:hypothetical protein
MVNRNLLFGFGAGLIVSAGFLSLLPDQTQPAAGVMTKGQLQSVAEAQNFVLVPKGEYEQLVGSKQSSKALPPKAPEQPKLPQATIQPQAASSVPAAPKKPEASKEIVSVTIPYRASAEDVESLLVQAGVLPKENKLIETLRTLDKLDRIRVGTYQLSKGTTEEQIVKMIATPPKQ